MKVPDGWPSFNNSIVFYRSICNWILKSSYFTRMFKIFCLLIDDVVLRSFDRSSWAEVNAGLSHYADFIMQIRFQRYLQ